MQIKMVYIPNNITRPTLNLNTFPVQSSLFKAGQTLNANIQSIQGNQVHLKIGHQTVVATTTETTLKTGPIQVYVKQTQPNVALAILPQKSTSEQSINSILQAQYRQRMPLQMPISQALQQLSLLPTLPPTLMSSVHQLLEQTLKSPPPLSGKELKQRLEQSGLFLESKLKNNPSTHIQKDLKAQLLSLKHHSEALNTKHSMPQLFQLANTLNQAINRLTIQQLQLYETPMVIPLELPVKSEQTSYKHTLEFRHNTHNNASSWEVLINTQLPQGELVSQLTINDQKEITCLLWCETPQLNELITTELHTLKHSFSDNQLTLNMLQVVPNKPVKTQHSTQITLIDIHI